MKDPRPILGITMGDPAGIGPEIIAKALGHPDLTGTCRPVVVGDAGVIENAVRIVGSQVAVHPITRIADAGFEAGTAEVYDLKHVDLDQLMLGKVSAMAGHAAFEAVRKVIELALDEQVDAAVTAPIHKEALHLAGHMFAGHTEIFAHFTGTANYAMMLAAGNLRVVHVSTHLSLRRACECVTKERVLKVIMLADEACRQLGIKRPRIGVAGLNPHASDGGLFGDEEARDILPAVAEARSQGLNVEGPLPPDTLFPRAVGGAYDICVAMYHDQGHIPVKLLGFRYDSEENSWRSVGGVNVTLGLPILRVSVDHGTAFDQAGKGTASEESLLDAIDLAVRLSTPKAHSKP
jgi:4-hydroxythreonine-4-phosphate dehydrogenase